MWLSKREIIMRKVLVFLCVLCLLNNVYFAENSYSEKTCSQEKPIPGTEVPEEYEDVADRQWEVFANDKGELKNMALEGAEYDNLAIDENDDSMSQFNRSIINERVQSGRHQ